MINFKKQQSTILTSISLSFTFLVCANDGNTYDNLCEMQKYGCQNQLNLSAKYFGICGKFKI